MGKVLIGILIGMIVGVGIALGVVMYLGKPGHTPKSRDDSAKVEAEKPVKSDKSDKSEKVEKPEKADGADKTAKDQTTKLDDKMVDKKRFDFYDILKGEEPAQKNSKKDEPKAETKPKAVSTESKEPKEAAKEPKAHKEAKDPKAEPTKAEGTYFLQVASLTNQGDADELKAKLSLLGMQARVVAVNLPEKGMRYRVRVGPYGGIQEVDRARDDLRKHNLQADLIKHKEGN